MFIKSPHRRITDLKDESDEDTGDLWLNFSKLVLGLIMGLLALLRAQGIEPFRPYQLRDITVVDQVVSDSNPLLIRFIPILQSGEDTGKFQYEVTIVREPKQTADAGPPQYRVTYEIAFHQAMHAEGFQSSSASVPLSNDSLTLNASATRIGTIWEASFSDKQLFAAVQPDALATPIARSIEADSLYKWPSTGEAIVNVTHLTRINDLPAMSIIQGHMENYPDMLRQWQHRFYSGDGPPPLLGVEPLREVPSALTTPLAQGSYVAQRSGLYFHESGDYAGFWAGGTTPGGVHTGAVMFVEGEYRGNWYKISFYVEDNIRPGVYGGGAEDSLDVLLKESESVGANDQRRANLSARILDLDAEDYLGDASSRTSPMRWGKWKVQRNPALRSLTGNDGRIFREGGIWYFDFGTAMDRASRLRALSPVVFEDILVTTHDGVSGRPIRLRVFYR